MRPPARLPVAAVGCLLAGLASACGGSSAATPASSPRPGPASAAVPDIALPEGPLRELVPASADLPAGMVPVIAGTGPRDVMTVAGYSADPPKAQGLLTAHGFQAAYVGQYADPTTGHVLSVVVTRFATEAGAAADLTGDLGASAGTAVPAPQVGDQSEVRTQPLPQSKAPGQLVTVRFRKAATSWLVAYGSSPTADPQVPLGIAQLLVSRV